MTVLLDTHTFLWWHDQPERLSPIAYDTCISPENDLLLSVVSIWEMQIKLHTGKLTLARPLRQLVDLQINANPLRILPVEAAHIWELSTLPPIHKDPFDRLLIAQARSENATLLSVDAAIAQYPVSRLW